MRSTKVLKCGLSSVIFMSFLLLTLPNVSLAQTNPCSPSQNPCSANPCAAKNPCAGNPCAPTGKGAGSSAKATMVRGEVVKVDPRSGKLLLRTTDKQINLTLSKHAVVREGQKVKKISQVKPGDKAMVSYVQSGRNRTAWYIYLAAAAAGGNPCAANPCAAKNPCAANPCALKNPCSAKNPCAANPCAAKNPCAPKNPCGVR